MGSAAADLRRERHLHPERVMEARERSGYRIGHSREADEGSRPGRMPHSGDPDVEEVSPRVPECGARLTGQAGQFMESPEHEPMADLLTAGRLVPDVGNHEPFLETREQGPHPRAVRGFQRENIGGLPLCDLSVRPGHRPGGDPARVKMKPSSSQMPDRVDRPDELAVRKVFGLHGISRATGGMEVHPHAGVDPGCDMD